MLYNPSQKYWYVYLLSPGMEVIVSKLTECRATMTTTSALQVHLTPASARLSDAHDAAVRKVQKQILLTLSSQEQDAFLTLCTKILGSGDL